MASEPAPFITVQAPSTAQIPLQDLSPSPSSSRSPRVPTGGAPKTSLAPHASGASDTDSIGGSSFSRATSLTLAFGNVFYRVPTLPQPILKGVAGTCSTGQLTAIMGPSGCGKSTLLDILARRKTAGTITGRIELNGQSVYDLRGYRSNIGYVTQEDVFIPSMSVYETVLFYANVRLPESVSFAEKAKRVRETLEILELSDVADTKIGGELPGGHHIRGISGGQMRRVSVACALVTAPKILYLDEPTSGLDAASARTVMDILRKISNNNKLVVCSIHQPRSSIFFSFDNVFLLGLGYPLYTGTPAGTIAFTERHGSQFNKLDNPADFLLDFVSKLSADELKAISDKEFSITEEEKVIETESVVSRFSQAAVRLGANIYQTVSSRRGSRRGSVDRKPAADGTTTTSDITTKTFMNTDSSDSQQQLKGPGKSGSAVVIKIEEDPLTEHALGEDEDDGERRASFWFRYLVLLHRVAVATVRNPSNLIARLAVFTLIGVITGLVFLRLGYEGSAVLQKVYGLFFAVVVQLLLPFTSISLFIDQRRFFNRERAQKLYRPLEYFAAVMTIGILQSALNALIFNSIVYGMYGLYPTFDRYFPNVLVMCTMHVAAVLSIIMCGNIAPNSDLTFAIGSFCVTIMQLFAGCLVTFDTLPLWIRWLQYVSIAKYGFEFVITNEYGNNPAYDCPVPGTCLFENGDAVVNYFVPFQDTNVLSSDMGILFSFCVFYLTVSFFALRYLNMH